MGFRDNLRQIFSVNDSPYRIAMSFAVGVFMGISLFSGPRVVGAFFLAWLLRLNKFIAIAGTCILNPWTIVPIYSFSLWLGVKLTGTRQILPDINWAQVNLIYLIKQLSSLILPFLVGTLSLGIISAVVGYFIIYITITRYRGSQPQLIRRGEKEN